MPNRILKESIKRSPEIDKLSWFEEVVFYRLIVTADDNGRCDGRWVLLKNDLFPTKDTVAKEAVRSAVEKLVMVGLIQSYEVNGMPYLCFPTWQRHQRVRNVQGKYPAPTTPCGNLRQVAADCGELRRVAAKCGLESESEIESESESEGERERASARSTPPKDRFGEFNNVLLSQDEFDKLVELYPTDYQERIDRLSSYIASKGTRYKSHYATIRNWARREEQEAQAAKSSVDFMDIDF